MNELNYNEQLDRLLSRLAEIMRQRSDLDVEADKVTQLIHATANMLPDGERNDVLDKWTHLFRTQLNSETSLTDSVRKAIQESNREWQTAAQVRNRIVLSGFDFSAYMSNPLASVSTTLARLKEKGEVETTSVEGVTAYRSKKQRVRNKVLPPIGILSR